MLKCVWPPNYQRLTDVAKLPVLNTGANDVTSVYKCDTDMYMNVVMQGESAKHNHGMKFPIMGQSENTDCYRLYVHYYC
jgi:hypothetical protein